MKTHRDEGRAIILLAIFVFVAGFAFVDTRYQRAIGEAQARASDLYARTLADQGVIAQSARLKRMQSTVDADLHRVAGNPSFAGTTASMLAMLDLRARRDGTIVRAYEPERVTPDALDAKNTDDLQAQAVTIRIRGRFAGILRFVAALPEHGSLVRVADTELALANASRKRGRNIDPFLEATIHATLYRLIRPPASLLGGKNVATDR